MEAEAERFHPRLLGRVMKRNDPAARPPWLLARGGLRVEAEIVACLLGDWLQGWEGDVLDFAGSGPPQSRT